MGPTPIDYRRYRCSALAIQAGTNASGALSRDRYCENTEDRRGGLKYAKADLCSTDAAKLLKILPPPALSANRAQRLFKASR